MKEGYKKTEVGVIPNEWEIKTTGDIFEFTGGLSISREKLGEEGVNYLHYGDIHKRNENFINVEVDGQWLPKFNVEYSSIKDGVKLETGDVVFADASEDYEGVAKSVSILNYDKKPFVAGLHTIVGKDKNNILDEHYKRYCFSTKNIRKQFRILATGTSVYGISRENIKKIKLVMPPLKEQQKIAQTLSTVDSQIDDTDKLIGKTKELKKGLMQRLLTKGIGHTEFKKTEIGEIPVEWEVKLIGDIMNFQGGSQPPKEYFINEKKEGYIRLIQIRDYKTNDYKTYIPLEMARKFCSKEDIMIGRYGPPIFQILKGLEGAYNVALLKVIPKETVLEREYARYFLSTEKLFNLIDRLSQRTSGQTGVDMEALNNYTIPIPSLKEQMQIADILSSVDTQIQEYENKKSKLEELKQGLMQQLLTGKIRA